MPKLARLYLDTARLGLMSPSAQLAARDFARLAGEGVSTLYIRRFLQDGTSGLESRLRRKLSGLTSWGGIANFQKSLRHRLCVPPGAPLLVASRTSSLVVQTCNILARRCQNVLVTDTLWPSYREILKVQCAAHGSRLTTVLLRDEICRGERSADQIIDRLHIAYQAAGCDGILLSSISHDGLRLPVPSLVSRLRSNCRVELSVIDGAQEFAQAPVDLRLAGVDVYWAGCHKWLGAHLPLGICCMPRAETSARLVCEFQAAERRLKQVDPLQLFLASLEDQTSSPVLTETVNLMPLMTAAGAIADLASQPSTLAASFALRLENVVQVARLAEQHGWIAKLPPAPFRTGILLIAAREPETCALSAAALQARMDPTGVTLTAYDGGCLRLSMPDRNLQDEELARIQRALRTGQPRAASNGRTTRRRSGRASTGTSGSPVVARL